MSTLLVERAELALPELEVSGESYRHLFRAARLRAGDEVRVVDGEGHARRAVVRRVSARAATLVLYEAAASRESASAVTVCVPLPRPERADWLVEKLTEVGVARIVWLRSERAPREARAPRLQRFARVAKSALEQCGRSRLPEITGPLAFDAVLALAHLTTSAGGQVFWLDGGAPARAAELVAAGRSGADACLVIGPEGGFSAAERVLLLEQGQRGLRAASLGDRTLRVETAAVLGAALLLAEAPGASVSSGFD